MVAETFVVGINAISVYGGVVIMDLMGLSPTERDAQGQPTKEIRQRIILTPQATLETFNAMQSLMARLEQAGLIKRAAASATASATAPDPDPAPDPAAEESESAKDGGNGGKKAKRKEQPKTPNF